MNPFSVVATSQAAQLSSLLSSSAATCHEDPPPLQGRCLPLLRCRPGSEVAPFAPYGPVLSRTVPAF
jgi:hypothetical protein